MVEVHHITEHNYLEAHQAIRDILFLYDHAVTHYEGFGHSLEIGTFDPFRYITAVVDEEPGYTLGLDLDLIHQGSVVALLCILSDAWDDYDAEGIGEGGPTGRILLGLDEGLFKLVPLAEDAARAAFEDEAEFREDLREVYEKYIVASFYSRYRES